MQQHLLRNSTVKVAELLQRAIAELASLRRSVITAEIIAIAMLEQKDSMALKVFDELGLDTPSVRKALVDELSNATNEIPNQDSLDPRSPTIRVSLEAQALFDLADKERENLSDTYISTGAVFLAFLNQQLPTTQKIFFDGGIKYDEAYQALQNIRGQVKITEKDSEARASLLEEYTTDITQLARKGQLDPVIGRETEIKRVIEILSRRNKNNPILIGEPGVGKTVIIEGLAQQIVNADVPENLLHKRVVSLDMGTLIAGAKMQGEFEERLKSIKDEVIASSGDIILFIDEIHTVVGAGRSGGGLDASNMLKPALAKGLLQCMGATTIKEYKQFIESDKALERRFQTIRVQEPSYLDAIKIIQGIITKYENHHQITYTEKAIVSAVELSQKYLHQRQLPDKAIDLIDEAGAAKRMKVIYTPPEMRKMESQRQQFETKKIQAFNERNFQKMADHQVKLSEIEVSLTELRKKYSHQISPQEMNVTEVDVAQIVSQMTGIPVNKMIAEEAERLQSLELELSRRIIGQEHAVKSIANAIRRNRSGLRRPEKPIASFLFLGPTGVGKTELAKALAELLFDDESKIIRLDMSEYMQRHDVSKMIGSPPGYVGYGEGGQLTEKVKHQPYAIILLDEFEKAHPDVYNLLLPVLDEGYLTDAEGQKINFSNTLIIGTSNAGSHVLTEKKRSVGLQADRDDQMTDDEKNSEIMKELKNYLRPEFLNRLDEVVIFNPLDNNELTQIVELNLTEFKSRLDELGYSLSYDDSLPQLLMKNLNTHQYGARPLKRRLETLIENEVATLLIEHREDKEGHIHIKVKDDDGVEVIFESSKKSSSFSHPTEESA